MKNAIYIISLLIAVLLAASVVAQNCIDADNGKNYDVKATISMYGGVLGTDFCDASFVGKNLREYYCKEDSVKSENYNCPYGCNDGTCMQSPSFVKYLSYNPSDRVVTIDSAGSTVQVAIQIDGTGNLIIKGKTYPIKVSSVTASAPALASDADNDGSYESLARIGQYLPLKTSSVSGSYLYVGYADRIVTIKVVDTGSEIQLPVSADGEGQLVQQGHSYSLSVETEGTHMLTIDTDLDESLETSVNISGYFSLEQPVPIPSATHQYKAYDEADKTATFIDLEKDVTFEVAVSTELRSFVHNGHAYGIKLISANTLAIDTNGDMITDENINVNDYFTLREPSTEPELEPTVGNPVAVNVPCPGTYKYERYDETNAAIVLTKVSTGTTMEITINSQNEGVLVEKGKNHAIHLFSSGRNAGPDFEIDTNGDGIKETTVEAGSYFTLQASDTMTPGTGRLQEIDILEKRDPPVRVEIARAQIQLLKNNKAIVTARTNDCGIARIDNIPPGTYTLRATAENYDTKTETVEITAGGKFGRVLYLNPETPTLEPVIISSPVEDRDIPTETEQLPSQEEQREAPEAQETPVVDEKETTPPSQEEQREAPEAQETPVVDETTPIPPSNEVENKGVVVKLWDWLKSLF